MQKSSLSCLKHIMIILIILQLSLYTPHNYVLYQVPRQETLRPASGLRSSVSGEIFEVLKRTSAAPNRAEEIIYDGVRIKVSKEYGAVVARSGNAIILKNADEEGLRIESKTLWGKKYFIIGNATYIIRGEEIDLSTLNPLGNVALKRFLDLSTSEMSQHIFHIGFLDTEEANTAELFPASYILHPDLMPPKVDVDTINRMKQILNRVYADIKSHKGISINLADLMHAAAIVALNGDWKTYQGAKDYHMVQDLLNEVVQLRNYPSIRHSIRLVQDYLQMAYIAYDKERWEALADEIRKGRVGAKGASRTETIFERQVSEIEIPPKEGYDFVRARVVKVRALDANTEVEPLSTTAGSEIYDLGKPIVDNGRVVTLLFSGGSATTPKKIMHAHKMIHDAIHVEVTRDGQPVDPRWISVIEAHVGVCLGQSPDAKVVVVTSLAGTMEDESDKSIWAKLAARYPKMMASGQLSVVRQKTGLVLDPKTAEPMRFKDGRLALCAEDHLWALLAMLMDKDSVIRALKDTDGIVFLGNGDNVLNYPQEGMAGQFVKARREGRALATVSVLAPSAGDKKGGFRSDVTYEITYRDRQTGREVTELVTLPKMTEISDFPTRDKKETKFSAIDLAKEKETEFYRQCGANGWFIEDIFRRPDGQDKTVAFNISFHAIDLRLYAARIFGLDERDPRLVERLDKISSQQWVNEVLGLGNKVVKSLLTDKKVPNEVGSEEVTGVMTEQKSQELVFNTVIRFLNRPGLPRPEVMGVIGNRANFFAPYKGTDQDSYGPDGSVEIDPRTGKPIQYYDLFANRHVYARFVEAWQAAGRTIPLGDDGGEVVSRVIVPANFQEIVDAAHRGAREFRFEVNFEPTPASSPSAAKVSSLGVPAVGRLIDPGTFIERDITGAEADRWRATIKPITPAELEEALEFLDKSGGVTMETCLRGADLGSSMDLGRGAGMKEGLKELVTPREEKDLADVAQTIIIPSKFTAKMTITRLTPEERRRFGKGSIVYVSDLHNCPATKPGVFKEPIKLKDGKAPRKQADMIAYTLWNIYGIHSVKVVFDVYKPGEEDKKYNGLVATQGGGMGTSGATNTLLQELGSFLRKGILSRADCASEAIDDENTKASGYTGGQEGYTATAAEPEDHARAVDLVWISGIKDANGNPKYHPHSAFAVPMLINPAAVRYIEDSAVILQMGARFELNPQTGKVEKRAHRAASCINTGWMHSAETIRNLDGQEVPVDPVGAEYHKRKIGHVRNMRNGLTDMDAGRFREGIVQLNRGNMGHVVERDNLSLREAQRIAETYSPDNMTSEAARRLRDYSISDRIGLATFALPEADKRRIEAQLLPILEKEKNSQDISGEKYTLLNNLVVENLKRLVEGKISLYSNHAKPLFTAIDEEMAQDKGLSMSAFLVGAGGDGGIIMLWSSKGTEHIKDFLLRRFGIKQFDPEEVVRITTQTGGTLKGWMPFEIGEIGTRTSFGNADMTMEKAAKMGFRTPKASPIMQYDEETALYSPVSAPSAAKITADTATAVSETLYRRHNTFITIGQAA